MAAILLTAVAAQSQEKTIQVFVTVKGNEKNTKLSYYQLDDIVPLKSLPMGKHRFYIKTDDACKISLVEDKGPKITPAERKAINAYFEKYTIEYFNNEVKVTDCKKFNFETLQISIFKTK